MRGDASSSEPAWTPSTTFWGGRSVAVTGATGFLGSHLVAALVSLDAQVVALVRDDVPGVPAEARWASRVAVVRGSVEDETLVERLLAEYETRTVLHLAAQSQVRVANRSPAGTWRANVGGTWSILEAARRSPTVEQVVTASSDKAYGSQPNLPYTETMPLRAVNPYDVSKACGDLISTSYAATFGMPVCITRCGNLFGPGDRNWDRIVPGTIRSLLAGDRPVIRSDGSMVRDYLYVVDAAEAYVQLVERMDERPGLAGEPFNFSTEAPMSVLEIVDRIQKALGTDIELDVRDEASHEIAEQFLSAAKARRLLGWAPRHSLDDALAITVAWYRDELGT